MHTLYHNFCNITMFPPKDVSDGRNYKIKTKKTLWSFKNSIRQMMTKY